MATLDQRVEALRQRNAELVGRELTISNGPGGIMFGIGTFGPSNEISLEFTILDHPDKKTGLKGRKGWKFFFHQLAMVRNLSWEEFTFVGSLERARGARYFEVNGTYSTKTRKGTIRILYA